MPEPIDLTQLREAFLQAPESTATRVVAFILSGLLLSVVLILVRRRTLREEYTTVWVAVAALTVLVSVRLDFLHAITRLVGAWTTSSTLFFLGEVFLVLICLNYAVRLSRHGGRLKSLAQEVALLRSEVERLGGGDK